MNIPHRQTGQFPHRRPWLTRWAAALLLCTLLAACSRDRGEPEPASDSPPANGSADLAIAQPAPGTPRPAPDAPPVMTETSAGPDTAPWSQVLDLPEFGRYAFVAKDPSMRVQVVDRMAGPLPAAAHRRDHVLEAGPIKVLLHSNPQSRMEPALDLHAYHELHGQAWPQLPEVRLLETTLADFQQRSYWIDVTQARWISLEVAGRYLDDLRLWRDGAWITEATPHSRRINADPGRPLQSRWIHARLEPGIYRLVVYGGPGEPWAEESQAEPLYLRKGIPQIPAYGWWDYQASPFGIERWQLSSEANRFQLKLDEAMPAQLSISNHSPEHNPFQGPSAVSGSLSKESRVAEILLHHQVTRATPRLINVELAPGTRYRLSALHHATSYALNQPEVSEYWIGVAGFSDPRDSIDASVVVVDRVPGRSEYSTLTAQLPTLALDRAWEARFNLLRSVDVLVQVNEGGRYLASLSDESEAIAEFRIEPMFQAVPAGVGSQWQYAGHSPWELNPGLYRLSMRPAAGHPGIAHVRFAPSAEQLEDTEPSTEETAEHGPPATEREVISERLGRDQGLLSTVSRAQHRMALLNDFEHGTGGLVLRPAPLTLQDPLPVTQRANSVRGFPLRAQRGSRVIAQKPDGSLLAIGLSPEGPWQDGLDFTQERSVLVHVHNAEVSAVHYNLRWMPAPELSEHGHLPAMNPARLASAVQNLPRLDSGSELRLQLARSEQTSHLLNVQQPALYRIESNGLLDTAGELRSRTALNLASASSGGSGRNFLIQQYLREGQYRLVTRSLGRSAGPLGLTMSTTMLLERGLAAPDTPVRASIEPEQAIRYRVPIDSSGEYRILASGLQRNFRVQLEGPDGWPLIAPGTQTPISVRLYPGEHYLTVLPQAETARAVTLISPPPQAVAELHGHGPHALALNERRTHLWREPEQDGQPRTPDQWQFALAAPKSLRVELSEGMLGELHNEDNGQQVASMLGTSLSRSMALAAGRYTLKLRAVRPDDRRRYTLAVHSNELPLNHQRSISVPGTLPLSLGRSTLVQLSSLSALDVEARLFDEQGQLVDVSDSRPDDWNFLITRQLPAGRYTLQVSAAEGVRGQALVRFSEVSQVDASALTAGDNVLVEGLQAQVMPLKLPQQVPAHGYPLILSSHSDGTHGVSLERHDGLHWQVLDTHSGRSTRSGIVIDEQHLAQPHRVRVWPLDDVAEAIHLLLHAAPELTLPASGDDQISVAMHALGDSAVLGLTRLPAAALARSRQRENLMWAGPSGVFQPVRDGWIPASDTSLWLLADAGIQRLPLDSLRSRIDQPLQFPLSTPTALRSDDLAPPSHLRLWVAQTSHTPPVLRYGSSSRAWSVAGRSTVAVALPAQPATLLYLQRGDGQSSATSVQVTERALAVDELGALGDSPRQLQLPARSAAHLRLQNQPGQTLQLAAPAAVAAIVGSADGIQQVFWTGVETRTLQGAAAGDTLWLANTGDSAASISVRYLAASSTAELSPQSWFQQQSAIAGEWVLAVPALPENTIIQLGGTLQDAWYVSDSGQVSMAREQRVAIPEGDRGRLHLRHLAGSFGAWLEGADDGGQAYQQQTINIASATLLSVRTSTEQRVSIHLADARRQQYWLDPQAGLDLILPAGEHQLLFSDADAASETLLRAPEPLSEGLGEALRLAPGGSHAYRFTLNRPRSIGLGIRAEREVVQARLLDANGELLGVGIAQMHAQLPAGDYFLLVHLPGDETAVELRPALVGSEAPDDVIPEQIRMRLQQLGARQ